MWTYSWVGEGSEKPDRFDVGRLILMYGVAGDDAVGRRQLGRFLPINFVDPTYSGLLFAGRGHRAFTGRSPGGHRAWLYPTTSYFVIIGHCK